MIKVIISMAISPNGLTAREDGQEDWLPATNADDFYTDAQRFDNFIMGRETYELVTKFSPDYFNKATARHKIIITRNTNFQADGYTVMHGPEEAISFLEQRGVTHALVIGGGKLNTEYLKRQLVDEIWLTITPYIIGTGRQLIDPAAFDLPLELLEHRELSGGRILVKYKVAA
jgi:dihydrofolate reductase